MSKVPTDHISEEFQAAFVELSPAGSRVTCNPAPTDTDADYIGLVRQELHSQLTNALFEGGWILGGSEPTDEAFPIKEDEQFWSFTKGDVNLITTNSAVFFHRFMAATSVAKRLNLLDKADRIALFQAVLYGNASMEVLA